MSPPKTRRRKTVEDYMALQNDLRVELIEGEFFVTPSPTYRHQRIVLNIVSLLRDFVRKHSLGEVCVSPLDVVLPSGDVVQPDVLFLSKDRVCVIEDRVRGIPDLAVEVLSSVAPERDLIVKRGLYARNGVPEYWIVDDGTRSIEVFALEGSSYRDGDYFEEGDLVVSPAFPELSLPVRQVFE